MTGQSRRVSVLGVPTSAGSHNPGQEKAPAAWRAAGLIEDLLAAGLDVEDRGDRPAAPYRPVEPVDGLRDVDRVAEVAGRVASEVAAIRAAGRLPLVLGGDCTITLGALAGFGDGGLVYFDVDVLHTGLFPLANFPHFAGLTLEEVSVCLAEFGRGEKFGGLVITEVNPDHDPDGRLVKALAAAVATALAAAG